jgi:hypothetical protein
MVLPDGNRFGDTLKGIGAPSRHMEELLAAPAATDNVRERTGTYPE